MAKQGTMETSDGVRLEYELGPPPAGEPRGAAVVCHPHPLGGGDMHNHVVMAISRAARDSGLVALRFNFRGTGRSGGEHGGGAREIADVEAAASLARELVPGGRLVVMGYSFGAAVAARWLATGGRADALVAVALPEASGAPDLGGVPAMLVAGALDGISPPGFNRPLASVGRVEVVTLPGTDHFFGGALAELEGTVRGFLTRVAGPIEGR